MTGFYVVFDQNNVCVAKIQGDRPTVPDGYSINELGSVSELSEHPVEWDDSLVQ